MKDEVLEIENDPIFIMAKDCPLIAPEWCEYKGEVYVGELNYERSKQSKRIMIDLSFCMTKALNQSIMKTVMWNPKKFNMNPAIKN